MSQIQSKTITNPTTVTTKAITFTNNVTKGNTLFVGSCDNNGVVNSVSSITDTLGNTFIRAASVTEGSFVDVELWYCTSAFEGPDTITVNYAALVTPAIVIVEYSDRILTPAALSKDVSAVGNAITGTAMATAATSTPTQNRELVIVVGGSNGISSTTFSAGAGYANLVQITDATSGQMVGLEDKRQDAEAAQTGTMTVSSTGHWAIVAATFKLANTPLLNQNLRPHPFSPGRTR